MPSRNVAINSVVGVATPSETSAANMTPKSTATPIPTRDQQSPGIDEIGQRARRQA